MRSDQEENIAVAAALAAEASVQSLLKRVKNTMYRLQRQVGRAMVLPEYKDL